MHIGGTWRDADQYQNITDPYRGNVVALAPVSTPRDCHDALEAAQNAREAMAQMPGHARAALLRRVADNVMARADAMARAMSLETGKAIRDSRVEVERSADLLRMCAEEAIRIQGEHIPMDGTAIGAGKLAMLMRYPVGVVAAITPFNGPVSLTVHKLGPALAAGNTVVLKPSPKAPWCVDLLVQAFLDAGTPVGAINTLYGDAIAPQMVQDARVDFVSFTGSIRVGKIIRDTVGMKRVALELGGVAPTFVHHDADVVSAARQCARHSMALAGQSCISVQNAFVHKTVHDRFMEALCAEFDLIRFGDPMDATTDVGTLIDEEAARRVEGMLQRAVDGGARAVRGWTRQGALLTGAILTGAQPRMDVVCDEIFGPAMSVHPYEDIEPLFKMVSDSPVGLQAGIFTNSLDLAMGAIRKLRTGGVIVNGTSRWRSDQMPYGGVKDSGMGREGPKFSIRDMTEERLFVLN